jgi:N-acetylglutamate synthase-like GNAT family acetyltransferase
MFIRDMSPSDLDRLRDVDGAIESTRYLHLESAGEGIAMSWKVEERPMREKMIDANALAEDTQFVARQITGGIDEGVALVSEYDGNLIGILLARPDFEAKTLKLMDIRIDYDYRRQGMGSALVFNLIARAKEKSFRAVYAEAKTNNLAANYFLAKCGFELSGVDTRRTSNHDLVKESATLLWYAPLD